MNAVFLKILNMSLTASLLILAVLPIRLLIKKAPKWTVCLLWAIVAVALVAPVRLESKASVLPTETPIDISIPDTSPLPPIQDTPILVDDIIEEQNTTLENNRHLSLLEIGTAIWCCGMASLLGYALVSAFRLKRIVAVSIETEQNVFLCDDIDTPFILGVIRPHIYLPSALDEATAQQVLLHERAHLARKDHWWKPLGYLLLTLHWFNPLVWVSYILLCTDIELACDEKVIKQMDNHRKKTYSEALLTCSMPRHLIAACPLAFGEVGTKQRIKAVLSYKRPAFWMIVVVIVVCVALCFGFLTDPITKDEASIPHKELNSYLQQSSENILSAQLEENFRYGAFETQTILDFEDYKELCTILSALELKSKPIANDGLTRFAEKVISLTTADRGIISFCFNRIFTEFWIISSGNASAVYEVRNPAPLRELFNRFDDTNYMATKRVEMLFQSTEYGKSAGEFSVLNPHVRFHDAHYAVIAENDSQSTRAYLVKYTVDEQGTYQLIDVTKGITEAGSNGYCLNLTHGEQTILWGFVPCEKVYNDEDIIIQTTDKTYTVPIYSAAFIACLPNDAEIEAIAHSSGHPVNVNTISEQSGWDVFLEMNADTGDINVVTSHPLYSDVPLYIDMDESFTGNEALYAALKKSEHFSDGWPADLKLMGRQSYGDYEYAVLQFAQMHGPTAALVEYTIDGSAVTIHSYGEGYAPDTQGFLIGYHMNMAFMEGGTMYWSLYAPRYATTKDGKDLVDNNGLPPETVESNFTGFQFTMRDLKPYVFPADESFFLCEFTTVIPPAIVTPMEGRTLLAALGSECP